MDVINIYMFRVDLMIQFVILYKNKRNHDKIDKKNGENVINYGNDGVSNDVCGDFGKIDKDKDKVTGKDFDVELPPLNSSEIGVTHDNNINVPCATEMNVDNNT
ncbi:hypothetical protein Tco_1210198 [Tanacetum coccineum]